MIQDEDWVAKLREAGVGQTAQPKKAGIRDALTTNEFGGDSSVFDRLPITGGIAAAARAYNMSDAAAAYRDGEATDRQIDLLDQYIDHRGREMTYPGKVADAVDENIDFMLTFAMGRKAGKWAGAKLFGRELIEEMADKRLRDRSLAALLAKGAKEGVIAMGAGQAVTGGALFQEQVAKNMLGQFTHFTEDEAGQIGLVITNDVPSFVRALPPAVVSLVTEGIAESSGAALTKLPVVDQFRTLAADATAWFFRKNPDATPGMFTKMIREAGWDGLVEEWMEERYAGVLRMAAGKMGVEGMGGIEEVFPGAEEMAVELGALTVMGGGARLADAGLNRLLPKGAVDGVAVGEAEEGADATEEQAGATDGSVATTEDAGLSETETPAPAPTEDFEPEPDAPDVTPSVATKDALASFGFKAAKHTKGTWRAQQVISKGTGDQVKLIPADGMEYVDGMFSAPGEIVVSTSSVTAPEAVALHEAVHNYVYLSGGTAAGNWDQVALDIRKADPWGWRQGRKIHRGNWISAENARRLKAEKPLMSKAEAGQAYRQSHVRRGKHVAAEETFATTAQGLVGYMQMLQTDKGRQHMMRLANRSPETWGKIKDWIGDLWRKWGPGQTFEQYAKEQGIEIPGGKARREAVIATLMLSEALSARKAAYAKGAAAESAQAPQTQEEAAEAAQRGADDMGRERFSPAPLNRVSTPSEPSRRVSEFSVGDHDYWVSIRDMGEAATVSFARDGKMDVLGDEPNPKRVFDTVVRAMREYVDERGDTSFVFRAALDEESRVSLYDKFAERAERLGMRVQREELTEDGEVRYEISTDGVRFMMAWHGTGAEFDEFRDEFIGTGEGAQAFGHGHYFAGDREVGEHYKQAIGTRALIDRLRKGDDLSPQEQEFVDALEEAELLGFESKGQAIVAAITRPQEYDLGERLEEARKGIGTLYQVDLAPAEEDYLLWDRPLSEQSEKVREALEGLGEAVRGSAYGFKPGLTGSDLYRHVAGDAGGYRVVELSRGVRRPYGETFETRRAAKAAYAKELDPDLENASEEFAAKHFDQRARNLKSVAVDRVDGDRAASQALLSAGIRGIKYLDGTSRSAGDGSFNYVIFDPKDAQITERFSPAPPVDSPAFKRWFGDSKVVDENGDPLVVYHGTQAVEGFNVPSHARIGARDSGYLGHGFYFTTNPDTAAHYAGGEGGGTFPVYLSLQNPLVLEQRMTPGVTPERIQGRTPHILDALGLERGATSLDIKDALRERGHDGVLYRWGSYAPGEVEMMALGPESIKSATGNRGTFDPADPDIRMAPRSAKPSNVRRRLRTEANLDQFHDDRARAIAGEQIGRPDLAKTLPEKLQSIQDAIDEMRNREGLPEPVHMGALQESALELVEQHFEAMKRRLIGKVERGQTLTEIETFAFREIGTQLSAQAVRTGDQKDWEEALVFGHAYRESGAQIARSFVARKALFNRRKSGKEILAEMVSQPSKRVADKISRFMARLRKDDVTEAERKEIQAKIQQMLKNEAAVSKKVDAALRKAGFDPDKITSEHWADRATVTRLIRTIARARATGKDKAAEYLYYSYLSFPYTHARNVSGNVLNVAISKHLQELVEGMLNVVVRDENSVQVGELGIVLKNVLPGLREGFQRMVESFRYESLSDPKEVDRLLQEGGRTGTATPSWMAPLRWISTDLIKSVDNFFKGYLETIAIAQLAYRKAKAEGHSGATLNARMNELMYDPTIDATTRHRTLELLFQDTAQKGSALELADKMGKQIRDYLDRFPGIPLGVLVLPFRITPVRLIAQAMRRTPLVSLNFFGTMFGIRQKDGYTKKSLLIRDAADAMIGWGFYAMISSILDDEDEDGVPYLTGLPSDNMGERALSYMMAPPMSFRVGDQWFGYKARDPLAMAMASTVSAVNAAREGDASEGARAAFKAIGEAARDSTYLRTVGEVSKLMDGYRHPAQFASRQFVTPWVPNILKGTNREMDETLRNRAWKDYEDASKGDLVLKYLPWELTQRESLAPAPKVDWLGRETKRTEVSLMNGFLLERRLSAGDPSKLDRLVYLWNQKEHDEDRGEKGWFPGQPRHYFSRNGQKIVMTEDEYARYLKETGQEGAQRLLGERLNWDDPTMSDIKRIQRTFERIRDQWKNNLVRQRQSEGA